MSDNLEMNKQKLHNLLNDEMRVAINMDQEEIDHQTNIDYSLESTMEDNRFINRVLNETGVVDYVLSEKEKTHLRNTQSRNWSHI